MARNGAKKQNKQDRGTGKRRINGVSINGPSGSLPVRINGHQPINCPENGEKRNRASDDAQYQNISGADGNSRLSSYAPDPGGQRASANRASAEVQSGNVLNLDLHQESSHADGPDIFVHSKHPLAQRMIHIALGSNRNVYSALEHFSPELACRISQRCRLLILDTYSSLEWAEVLTRWRSTGVRVLVLVPPDSATIGKQVQFLRLGAWGVVPVTDRVVNELQAAIGCVAEGGYWVHRGALDAYVRHSEGPAQHRSQNQYLTVRERQIVSYVVRGLSNKQIGSSLGISERTVKFHVTNLLNKLKLKSRWRLLDGEAAPLWLTSGE